MSPPLNHRIPRPLSRSFSPDQRLNKPILQACFARSSRPVGRTGGNTDSARIRGRRYQEAVGSRLNIVHDTPPLADGERLGGVDVTYTPQRSITLTGRDVDRTVEGKPQVVSKGGEIKRVTVELPFDASCIFSRVQGIGGE